VFDELAGKESFTGLLALSILGRRLSPEHSAILDDVAGVVTLADPRIRPLKLTRLVASYGATIPAVAAGLLMEEGARIGPMTTVPAARALRDFHEALEGGPPEPELVARLVGRYLESHRFVWGFGTPFRSSDERLVAFRECMRLRGRDTLPYWQTMEAVAIAVQRARNAEPNIGIALAAAMLDMDFSPEQIGALVAALMQHMFFGHAFEEAQDPSAVLAHLPDAAVEYVGREPRMSPSMMASRASGTVPAGGSGDAAAKGTPGHVSAGFPDPLQRPTLLAESAKAG
jgi:hypothetical protein